jgi:hypothetical protein
MEHKPETVPDYLDPGFDAAVHLTYHEKIKWERQERLLEGYAAAGTIKAGLLKSGVPRRTVEDWRRTDLLGFRRRFEESHRAFCDEIEDKMWRLSSALKPGQNSIPLIALANANMPEKYRPDAKATDDLARAATEALVSIGRAMQVRVDGAQRDLAALPSPIPSPPSPPSLPVPSQGQAPPHPPAGLSAGREEG